MRGLNEEGNAANYAETEHAFVYFQPNGSMKIASYVQVRGSIPLIWSMKPNLKKIELYLILTLKIFFEKLLPGSKSCFFSFLTKTINNRAANMLLC